MRKQLLYFVFFVCGSAAAEWEQVGVSSHATQYADISTALITGYQVKMWSLVDYKNVQTTDGLQYRSVKEQIDYNCKELQSKGIYMIVHKENMGRGQTLISQQLIGDWTPVAPESAGQLLLNIACEHRIHVSIREKIELQKSKSMFRSFLDNFR